MKRVKANISDAFTKGVTGPPINLNIAVQRTDTDKYLRLGADSINQVDDNLFIGDRKGAENKAILEQLGIKHIINCAKELPNYHSDLHYLRLELNDGQNQSSQGDDLYRVAEATYRYIASVAKLKPDAKFLVHCAMGKSRSASVVVYYLMRRYGIGYDQALGKLKEKRPIVEPNPWYEKQLRDIADLITGRGR